MTEVCAAAHKEFDFLAEGDSQNAVADMLSKPAPHRATYKMVDPFYWVARPFYRPPVQVPRTVPGLVSPTVLVMQKCQGSTLTRLSQELNADPDLDRVAAGRKIVSYRLLENLSEAFARMVFEAPGITHGDPHPGNILMVLSATPLRVEVALVDWGQICTISEDMQLHLARLVVAMTESGSGSPPLTQTLDADDHLDTGGSSSSNQIRATRHNVAVAEAMELLGIEFEGREKCHYDAHGTRISTRQTPTEKTERAGDSTNVKGMGGDGVRDGRLPPWTEEPPVKSAAATALATHFFDTTPLSPPWEDHPLSEAHPLRTLRVTNFPKDLILTVRAVQILKAISEDAGLEEWDLAQRWRPHALHVLKHPT
uniref:ABC1 atypical kinase-like domain-containing protein n=1 Tax=Octactis speculum TaxID=3111310 RepID=A0A7S2CVI0_9STRA